MIRRCSMPSKLNSRLQIVTNKIYLQEKNYLFKFGQHKNFSLRKTLKVLPSLASHSSVDLYTQLPEIVLKKIGSYLAPIDLIHIQQTCRCFRNLFAKWRNIFAIEIRLEEYTYHTQDKETSRVLPNFHFPSAVSIFTSSGKKSSSSFNTISKRIKSYHVKLATTSGINYQLRTTEESTAISSMLALLLCQTSLKELTIWDSCLTNEFASALNHISKNIETLRLWNCATYFSKKSVNHVKIIEILFGFPNLINLLVLDLNSINLISYFSMSNGAILSKTLVNHIRAPIQNLQLTNIYLPLRAMEMLVNHLAPTCTRLAIGCTFGKTSKRVYFLNALSQMKKLSNLDFPPFVFHLNENPIPDSDVKKLIHKLPLTSIGFRHYNSLVLFRFIETQLAQKIRIIRIHHSANRIPNFAELGKEPILEDCFDDVCSTTSCSITTQQKNRCSFLSTSSMRLKKLSTGTTYSNLSASSSSIFNNNIQNNFKEHSTYSLANYVLPQLESSNSSRRSTTNSRYSFMSANSGSISSNSWETNLSQLSGSETTSSNYYNIQTRKHSLDFKKQYNEIIEENLLNGKIKSHSQSCYHFKNFNTGNRQNFSIEQNDYKTIASESAALDFVANRLNAHQLTIFAISEEKRMSRSQRLRKRIYCGVDVYYLQESIESQEVFGRMALPIQSPHFYSKSLNAKYISSNKIAKSETSFRIIKGDLVKPIPLSSLGMESDYELSDPEN